MSKINIFMRLNEITLPYNISDAADRLNSAGWYYHNGGAFGRVFSKENVPYVLKLFDNRDRAYIAFVKLAKQYPNKHFPEFYGKLIKLNNQYSAVRIEKLYKANSSYLSLTKFIKFYLSNNYYFRLMDKDDKKDEKDIFHNFDKSFMYIETYDFMNANKELKTACDLISDHLLELYSLDIYDNSENVMIRKDNTLVITDPVAVN